MKKKRQVFNLLFLTLSFSICYIIFTTQEVMGGEKRLPIEKFTFTVDNNYIFHAPPNLKLWAVSGHVNFLNKQYTVLTSYDDSKYLGSIIRYNFEDNSIYAIDCVIDEKTQRDEVGKVIFEGETHQYEGKRKYYFIGKGKLEKETFKPSFLEGTWLSFRKRPFLDFFADNVITIHIPGDLKPAFVTYFIDPDRPRKEVLADR